MAGEQILVVKNNPKSMTLLRDVLRATGYRSLEASTARQALKLATKHGPALVLMDIRLPDMNGVVVLGRVRMDERTARIPVLAVRTGNEGGQRQVQGGGFLRLYLEPVDIDELLATVEQQCGCAAMIDVRVRFVDSGALLLAPATKDELSSRKVTERRCGNAGAGVWRCQPHHCCEAEIQIAGLPLYAPPTTKLDPHATDPYA